MPLLPFDDVGYCKRSLSSRKRTRLWNNAEQSTPRPLCNQDCDSMAEGRRTAQGAGTAAAPGQDGAFG